MTTVESIRVQQSGVVKPSGGQQTGRRDSLIEARFNHHTPQSNSHDRKEYIEQNELSQDELRIRARTLAELKTLVQAIDAGVNNAWQLTDLIFYARRPNLIDKPLTAANKDLLDEWNQISAELVHPMLIELESRRGLTGGFERGNFGIEDGDLAGTGVSANSKKGVKNTEQFDEAIESAVVWCPGLKPTVLKSLLAQESNFNPTVINQYGYAGIAQIGKVAAREVGLSVGIPGTASDERLNPQKAIPAAARILKLKAERLNNLAFSQYGQPEGQERWKFILAAYNGGEGTITSAMGHAYRRGLNQARQIGLFGAETVDYARRYACKWENIVKGGIDSPLAMATARYFPALAASKFHEIGSYPVSILSRKV